MGKLPELLNRVEELDGEAGALVSALVAEYEQEFDQVTAHLSQLYEELMLLYDMGGEIASTLDSTQVADRAVPRIRELLEASGGVLSLADGDQADPGRSHVVGAEGVGDCTRALIDWATRQAMLKDRPLIINDLASSEAPSANGCRSLVSSPLRARGRVIGAVHVLDKAAPGGFSTQDQHLLMTIASQIGVAIDNSRLFEQEQQRRRQLSDTLSELETTYDHTLAALSGALDLRDNETEGHARRVTRFTVRIGEQIGVTGQPLVDIERGALMHDLGKIGVPDSILLKPAKLTEAEWAVMRTHPNLGYQMIKNINFLANAAPIVLHHHERYDGGGYPSGLTGQEIPLGARIFSVADTFDAMTSDRPYRKALPYEVAREEIERCTTSQFDPEVVAAFCRIPEHEWDAIRADVEAQLALKRKDGEELRMPL